MRTWWLLLVLLSSCVDFKSSPRDGGRDATTNDVFRLNRFTRTVSQVAMRMSTRRRGSRSTSTRQLFAFGAEAGSRRFGFAALDSIGTSFARYFGNVTRSTGVTTAQFNYSCTPWNFVSYGGSATALETKADDVALNWMLLQVRQ
jgi:hypothetical protein